MPLGARIAIRSALVWLLAGSSAGLIFVIARSTESPYLAARALQAHVPAMLIGWFAQFVLGVAFWMLPKFNRADPRFPRGDERPFVGGILGLNGALALWIAAATLGGPATLANTGAALVVLGVATCASRLWPRVKAFGQ